MTARELVRGGTEKLIDAKEAAEGLGLMGITVSHNTLGHHWRMGRVRGHKINGRVRFFLSELVDDYCGASEERTPQAPPKVRAT